jgi:hypothetical protein
VVFNQQYPVRHVYGGPVTLHNSLFYTTPRTAAANKLVFKTVIDVTNTAPEGDST